MTRPLPLLRRSTAVLGWSLAVLVLAGASLAVTASRAFAQEQRVIIRTIDTSETPIVVMVDGVRRESTEEISELDVHSVNVYDGEEAQARFGEDHVIDVITREEARARGLPEKDATFQSFSFSSSEGEGSGLNLFRSSGSLHTDSLKVMIERIREGAEPMLLRLREGSEPLMLRHLEGAEPMMLRLREGMEPMRLREGDETTLKHLRERLELRNGDGARLELRTTHLDSLPGRLLRLGELSEGGVFQLRTREGEGNRLMRVGPGLDLREITDFPDGELRSVEMTRIDGKRHVVLRLRNGEIREFDLTGDAVGSGRTAPEAEKGAGPERSAFQSVRARPNPASSEVAVSYDLAEAADVRLRVYDIEGRLVYDTQRRAQAGRQSFEVDVTRLAPGAYIYRLESAGSRSTSGRFTVTR